MKTSRRNFVKSGGAALASAAVLGSLPATLKEMRRIVEDSGLRCSSSHFTMGEQCDSLDNRIEWAADMGLEQRVLASYFFVEMAPDTFPESASFLARTCP